MDANNPYAAPRAEVGASLMAGDFAGAVADFTRSRSALLAMAIALLVTGLIGTATTVGTLLRYDMGATAFFAFGHLAISLLTDVLAASALMWLRAKLHALSGEPNQLTVALQSIARFWMMATILWGAPIVLGYAMSFSQLLLPALAVSVGAVAAADPVRAARRWHDLVRVFLMVAGIALLLRVGSSLMGPLATLHFMPARVWLFGSVGLQLGFGFLVWRQLAPLEAFVAQPSAATLAVVAKAHRDFWRLAVWLAIGSFVLSFAFSVLGGFLR